MATTADQSAEAERKLLPIQTILDREQFDSLLSSAPRLIVNCHAPWAPPCLQVNAIIEALHSRPAAPHEAVVHFASLEPEKVPALLKRYRISTVPTILFFASGRLVRRQVGADGPALTKSVDWMAASEDDTLLRAACEVAVDDNVTIVMKGDPSSPRCQFCLQAVQILRENGVVFSHVDVFTDNHLRDAIKVIHQWPTFPIVFARGRLVGGVDRLRELADARRLIEELASEKGIGSLKDAPETKVTDLQTRLVELTTKHDVMLFMKGSALVPRCGFSRKTVDLLQQQNIAFDTFDILSDMDVRSGLKQFSDWPTFPQLYAKGKFIGGLDVIKDLVEAGELRQEMGLDES